MDAMRAVMKVPWVRLIEQWQALFCIAGEEDGHWGEDSSKISSGARVVENVDDLLEK
jgi:hypothetical protein